MKLRATWAKMRRMFGWARQRRRSASDNSRARFEEALPADAEVYWRVGTEPRALLDDLRDAF